MIELIKKNVELLRNAVENNGHLEAYDKYLKFLENSLELGGSKEAFELLRSLKKALNDADPYFFGSFEGLPSYVGTKGWDLESDKEFIAAGGTAHLSQEFKDEVAKWDAYYKDTPPNVSEDFIDPEGGVSFRDAAYRLALQASETFEGTTLEDIKRMGFSSWEEWATSRTGGAGRGPAWNVIK